ncbi:MAG: hexitol phosphatase HxpB [Acidimicrobiales bacterium]|jgi:sugar-phosphatase
MADTGEQVQRAEGVLFDMDGLLVDTERIWRRVQTDVFDEIGVDVRPLLGIGLITGMRADEAVGTFREVLGFAGPSDAELTDRIVEGVVDAVPREARLLPGALEAIEYCEQNGLAVALASGSVDPVIDAVVEHLGIRDRFAVIVSAAAVELGKPHPAVLLLTAERLGVDAVRCVVVEDALNGCIAAKAARMRVVAVPEPGTECDPRWVLADVVLASLGDFAGREVSALLGLAQVERVP